MPRIVSLIVCAVSLIGCASAPVSTDYDPSFSFASVRTYAWLDTGKPDADVAVEPSHHANDLMRNRIRQALESQMQSQGIAKVAGKQSADILLTFHMGIETRVEVYDFHDHFGYYPCFPRHCSPRYAYYPGGINHDHWHTEYQEGRLIVDMISPQSKKLVWRGISERRMPYMETPEQRRLFIVDTVGNVMSHFPPGRHSH